MATVSKTVQLRPGDLTKNAYSSVLLPLSAYSFSTVRYRTLTAVIAKDVISLLLFTGEDVSHLHWENKEHSAMALPLSLPRCRGRCRIWISFC